ncbi:hypothetical protein UFOVP1169_7 [uncultured Caudovirales phage]|uniref:Uncharacterized protein n=1 Tax=uncultured Caudovirales phage TaxID=2100421 RepID=A0A6J5QT87_9CAUD|nr:hypothetical protein UFOVP1169_7 [uncultured Caudovirales phage]
MSDMVQELLARLSKTDVKKPTLLDDAQDMYPALKQYPTQFKSSPGAQDFMLEHWSPGDTDNGLGYARPAELAPDQYGVEVYSDKTTPKDVAADIVSHRMVKDDPVTKQMYSQFTGSLTDNQKAHLQEQYQWAQANEGEKRPYKDWESTTGLPAAFRGMLFEQWPKDFNDKFYTEDQKQHFKALDYYLRAKK